MNLAPARAALDPILRVAPTLAMLALLVLAGWLGARWFLYFTSHGDALPPPAREQVQLAPAAEALASAHLFGAVPTAAGGEVVSNLNIKLKGVFASGPDAPSMAIINTGDRDQATRVGGEIVPGVVLESVFPRHVLLRRAGALERVNLEERQQVAVAAPPTTASASRRARARAAAAAEAAPSPVARPQRPEPHAPVGDVATEPPAAPPPAPMGAPAPQPATTAAPAPGAATTAAPAPGVAAKGLPITSVPPGSILERLGLQPGDVIRTVNGEAVASEADVARIVQQRGAQGTFIAEVQRGGMTIPIAVSPQR